VENLPFNRQHTHRSRGCQREREVTAQNTLIATGTASHPHFIPTLRVALSEETATHRTRLEFEG
jgi:hypothetical protein